MLCESCGHENIEGAKFCASCGILLPHPAGEHPWIGRLVGGRFRVTRVLGEGGMGVVYAGEQQMGSTVRKVAIKTLHPHLSQDPSVLARFHRECGTVSQLEHPNTIKVYDFGAEGDGTLYIAMEFVAGRSLDKVIEAEGPLPPTRVVAILEQVAGALDEAHKLGIVHRDLKPENIVLGERLGNPDFVKLLDFGIAARSESASTQKEQKLTQQGMVLGTPPYMSPEQFTGQELDRRSDVYSLGIIAYEMLTCRLPFSANTPWQWATEHMTAQPFPIDQVPSGQGVPRSMREVVMRALAKDPNERPSSAGELVHGLKAGIDGREAAGPASRARTEAMQAAPIATGPVSVQGAASSVGQAVTAHAMAATQDFEIPKQKSKAPAFVLIGALGLVLAGGAWFLVRGQKPEGETDSATSGGSSAAGAGGSIVTTAASSAPTAVPSSPPPEPSATGGSTASPPEVNPNPQVDPPKGSGGTGATQVQPKPPKQDCSACFAAAQSSDLSKVGSTRSSCSEADRTKCTRDAVKRAAEQAKAAADAKDCKRLRSIQSSLRNLGETSPRVEMLVKSCKK